VTIRAASESEFAIITDVWEASVRDTHDFLSEVDLRELRPQILNDWLPAVNVMVFTDKDEEIIGFSGSADEKLEMLFVAPSSRGYGVGKSLLNHAISEKSVRMVDVNEQNRQAIAFYQHFGFEVFDRSPMDGQGKPYPLLHMRLNPSNNSFKPTSLRGAA